MGTSRTATRAGLAGALALALLAGPLAPAFGTVPEPTPVPAVPGDPTEPPSTEPASNEPSPTPTPSASPSTPTQAPAGGTDVVPPTSAEPPSFSSLDAPPMAAMPEGPTAPMPAPTPIDAYVAYYPQSTCDPTAKPGTVYLQNLLLSYYGGRRSQIARGCDVGGTSEHKEGRALDWGLNAYNPAERLVGDRFVEWLTAVGPDGKPSYNARRLGVMYVIWNGYIWSNSSATSTVRPYTGSNPHTDHVHVSLSWFGAYAQTSWWTGVAVPSDGELRSYVRSVYADLFNRTPDPAGLQGWARALANGTPRIAVANAITSSAEYRTRLIAGAYGEFLDRSPDPEGSAGWLAAMGRGLTIQGLESGFLASDEYYQQAGGTPAGWVQQLYRHVLGRDAATAEVDAWVAVLERGASRQAVSFGFVLSTERLSTVVSGYYQDLLGRGIDEAGRQGWVTAIQNGGRTEQIIGGIIASDEYFIKALAPV